MRQNRLQAVLCARLRTGFAIALNIRNSQHFPIFPSSFAIRVFHRCYTAMLFIRGGLSRASRVCGTNVALGSAKWGLGVVILGI
ncbi:MAG: hypothetical protein ACP5VS_13815, partial [Desulfomonilaceae bacterium]